MWVDDHIRREDTTWNAHFWECKLNSLGRMVELQDKYESPFVICDHRFKQVNQLVGMIFPFNV